jgi:hypothetical protein
MARKVKVEEGSGNIFADLGLPDADTHFLKAQIVSEIYRLRTNVISPRRKPASSWESASLRYRECSRGVSANIP